MTDEEKAEEYAEKNIDIAVSMYNPNATGLVEQAYLDGLAEGRKEIEKMKKEIINLRKVINTLYTTDLSDIEEVGRIIDIGRYGNYGDL